MGRGSTDSPPQAPKMELMINILFELIPPVPILRERDAPQFAPRPRRPITNPSGRRARPPTPEGPPLARGREGRGGEARRGWHSYVHLPGSRPPGLARLFPAWRPLPVRGGGEGRGARPHGNHHPPAPRGRPGAAAAAAKWRRGGTDQAPPPAVLRQSEPPAAAGPAP